MAKLHEILAVEGDLESTATALLKEASDTFSKRVEHFAEHVATSTLFDEARQNENTVDRKAMVTTVRDKLKYVNGHLIRLYDTTAKKERTNQEARADVVIDGVTILSAVPATVLLNLESRLKALKSVYEQIPTLQPGLPWVKDPDRGEHVWKTATPETRFRTEKTKKVIELAPATKEHPAQVETFDDTVRVGKTEIYQWSGTLSPAEKSDLLARLDRLIRAVKKARQRANNTEVVSISVGKPIFDWLMG